VKGKPIFAQVTISLEALPVLKQNDTISFLHAVLTERRWLLEKGMRFKPSKFIFKKVLPAAADNRDFSNVKFSDLLS